MRARRPGSRRRSAAGAETDGSGAPRAGSGLEIRYPSSRRRLAAAGRQVPAALVPASGRPGRPGCRSERRDSTSGRVYHPGGIARRSDSGYVVTRRSGGQPGKPPSDEATQRTSGTPGDEARGLRARRHASRGTPQGTPVRIRAPGHGEQRRRASAGLAGCGGGVGRAHSWPFSTMSTPGMSRRGAPCGCAAGRSAPLS